MFTTDLIRHSASKNEPTIFMLNWPEMLQNFPGSKGSRLRSEGPEKNQDLSRVRLSEIVLRFAFSLSGNKVHRKNRPQQRYSGVQTTRSCKAFPSTSPPCLCKNPSDAPVLTGKDNSMTISASSLPCLGASHSL